LGLVSKALVKSSVHWLPCGVTQSRRQGNELPWKGQFFFGWYAVDAGREGIATKTKFRYQRRYLSPTAYRGMPWLPPKLICTAECGLTVFDTSQIVQSKQYYRQIESSTIPTFYRR
jgi:hypothetical protein